MSSSGGPKECSAATRPENFWTMSEFWDVGSGPSILYRVSFVKVPFRKNEKFQNLKISKIRFFQNRCWSPPRRPHGIRTFGNVSPAPPRSFLLRATRLRHACHKAGTHEYAGEDVSRNRTAEKSKLRGKHFRVNPKNSNEW